MKKTNKKLIVILIIIIVVLAIALFISIRKNSQESSTESTTTTSIVEKQVSTRTIQNTLTGSGQIAASSTEQLALSTTKYFKTMCVEENDEVKEGENILQYSDGTYLTADYDCVISTISVPETGSKATSSNYVEVQNIATLQMTLSVSETEINKVEKGQEVEITLTSDETKTYTGTITKIDSVGTYSSSGSTFTATIEFENDGNIKVGMSASCTVIIEEAEDVIAVPIEAIQTKDDEKYVVVVNSDGTTNDVTVETGISDDSYVEIISGLSGTETIQMVETTTTGSTVYSGSSSSSSSSSGFSGMGGSSMGGTSSSGFSGGRGTMGQ